MHPGPNLGKRHTCLSRDDEMAQKKKETLGDAVYGVLEPRKSPLSPRPPCLRRVLSRVKILYTRTPPLS